MLDSLYFMNKRKKGMGESNIKSFFIKNNAYTTNFSFILLWIRPIFSL